MLFLRTVSHFVGAHTESLYRAAYRQLQQQQQRGRGQADARPSSDDVSSVGIKKSQITDTVYIILLVKKLLMSRYSHIKTIPAMSELSRFQSLRNVAYWPIRSLAFI